MVPPDVGLGACPAQFPRFTPPNDMGATVGVRGHILCSCRFFSSGFFVPPALIMPAVFWVFLVPGVGPNGYSPRSAWKLRCNSAVWFYRSSCCCIFAVFRGFPSASRVHGFVSLFRGRAVFYCFHLLFFVFRFASRRLVSQFYLSFRGREFYSARGDTPTGRKVD